MKKTLLISLLFLFVAGSMLFADSITVGGVTTEVGALDTLLGSATLANSGDATELAWVDSLVGGTNTLDAKFTSTASLWIPTLLGNYALDLNATPEYFLIKIGAGSLPAGTPDHYLFGNLPSLEWGVVNLAGLNITSVERISHVDEFNNNNPVPEPATMLLLGSGLAGLGLFGRKRMKA